MTVADDLTSSHAFHHGRSWFRGVFQISQFSLLAAIVGPRRAGHW